MKFTKKVYGSPFVNKHIAEITGQRSHHRPYAWTRGEDAYSYITGGIALPSFDQPGYLVTMAVQHNTPGVMDCLNELVSEDEYELIERAQELQLKYGQGVISNWWGDPKSLMSLINERNINEDKEDSNPVYISAPVDADQKDAFQIYISRLRVSLRERHKTLMINSCDHLRNSILSFVRDKQAKSDNNPTLHIAGAIIHTVLMVRPWEQAIETTDLIPTTFADRAAYEIEKEEKAMEKELWE